MGLNKAKMDFFGLASNQFVRIPTTVPGGVGDMISFDTVDLPVAFNLALMTPKKMDVPPHIRGTLEFWCKEVSNSGVVNNYIYSKLRGLTENSTGSIAWIIPRILGSGQALLGIGDFLNSKNIRTFVPLSTTTTMKFRHQTDNYLQNVRTRLEHFFEDEGNYVVMTDDVIFEGLANALKTNAVGSSYLGGLSNQKTLGNVLALDEGVFSASVPTFSSTHLAEDIISLQPNTLGFESGYWGNYLQLNKGKAAVSGGITFQPGSHNFGVGIQLLQVQATAAPEVVILRNPQRYITVANYNPRITIPIKVPAGGLTAATDLELFVILRESGGVANALFGYSVVINIALNGDLTLTLKRIQNGVASILGSALVANAANGDWIYPQLEIIQNLNSNDVTARIAVNALDFDPLNYTSDPALSVNNLINPGEQNQSYFSQLSILPTAIGEVWQIDDWRTEAI